MSIIYHLCVHKTTAIKGVYDPESIKIDKYKTTDEYITSAHSGIIRGVISGILLGDLGVVSAIHQGALYGILNPLMSYFGH